VAYVLDPSGTFHERCNQELVEIEPVTEPADEAVLRRLIERHHRFTGSTVAERILSDWPRALGHFVRVMPVEYRRALESHRLERQDGGVTEPAAEPVPLAVWPGNGGGEPVQSVEERLDG